MTPPDRREPLLRTLADMCDHQQGNHGWQVFHRGLLDVARSSGSEGLDQVLADLWGKRPYISDAHAITLLGIALRRLALGEDGPVEVFQPDLPLPRRSSVLADTLTSQAAEIGRLMENHSNSFTGARRFLVPQVIVAEFARRRDLREVRLLDLGTSIGLLPRQLNNEAVFRRFAPDLSWSPVSPGYRAIPLGFVGGVDRSPLPTLEWVRTCHGPTDYYERRFAEVHWSWEQTAHQRNQVVFQPLDILDLPALRNYLASHRINVATCSFVLYQFDDAVKQRIIETVVESLGPGGLFLSMEPSHKLTRMGCAVRAWVDGVPDPLHVAHVSDGHFVGTVTTGPHFADLLGAGWEQ